MAVVVGFVVKLIREGGSESGIGVGVAVGIAVGVGVAVDYSYWQEMIIVVVQAIPQSC